MLDTWAKSTYMVQFQGKKKSVWSRGRAINKARTLQTRNSFTTACSKTAGSNLAQRESFNRRHQYKTQPCCQFWMAHSEVWLFWELEALGTKFCKQGLVTTPYCQGGNILAQRQHLLPPTDPKSAHLTTNSGKENRIRHTSLQVTLDLN